VINFSRLNFKANLNTKKFNAEIQSKNKDLIEIDRTTSIDRSQSFDINNKEAEKKSKSLDKNLTNNHEILSIF
jgi:hypothetical protein